MFRRSIVNNNKKAIIKWYFKCSDYITYPSVIIFFFALLIFDKMEVILAVVIYVFGWMITEVPLKSELQKADIYLNKLINENSKIVIMQKASFLFPCSYIYKLKDIILLRFKHQDNLVVAKKEFIFVPEFLAAANLKLFKNHDIFYYCDGKSLDRIQKNPLKKKLLVNHGWDNLKLCTTIVVDHTKYTTKEFNNHTIRYIDSSSNINVTEDIISALSKDHGLLQTITKYFEPVLAYSGKEPGKCFALKMIQSTINSLQSDTEYFYELIKLFEFITHYKCFSDFEEKGNTLFIKPQDASLGSLQSGCIENNRSDLLYSNEYLENVKYMFKLLTGSASEVKKNNPAFYGRQILVTLRNRTIGHGAIAYAVSLELVEKLIVIIAALTQDFFLEPEPMQKTLKIHNVFDKYIEDENGLCLLISTYDFSHSGKYLNYSNGNIKVTGERLKINLCKGTK